MSNETSEGELSCYAEGNVTIWSDALDGIHIVAFGSVSRNVKGRRVLKNIFEDGIELNFIVVDRGTFPIRMNGHVVDVDRITQNTDHVKYDIMTFDQRIGSPISIFLVQRKQAKVILTLSKFNW